MAKGDNTNQGITGNNLKSGLNLNAPNFNGVGSIGSGMPAMNAGLNPNAGFSNAPLAPQPMVPNWNNILPAITGAQQGMRSFIGPYNNVPTNNAPAIIPTPNQLRQPGGGGINEMGAQTENPIGPSDDLIRKLQLTGHNVGQ